MLTWSKVLSLTDAQRPTQGYPVAYLRFTQSGNPQHVWTWFRNTFFGGEKWYPWFFGENHVERADVKIDVTVLGKSLGKLDFFLTHDANRAQNNSTPTVYLHYPDALLTEFHKQDLSGKLVTVTNNNGAYTLSIT